MEARERGVRRREGSFSVPFVPPSLLFPPSGWSPPPSRGKKGRTVVQFHFHFSLLHALHTVRRAEEEKTSSSLGVWAAAAAAAAVGQRAASIHTHPPPISPGRRRDHSGHFLVGGGVKGEGGGYVRGGGKRGGERGRRN